MCAALGLLALAAAPAAGLGAGPVIVYADNPAAIAIHDGGSRVAGIGDAYRQAPAQEDPRYPRARRVGKVRGADLAALSAGGMVAAIRAQLRQRDVGDLVAVDEVDAPHFTPARLSVLADALTALGPDARRVVFYVAPGTVGQIGRADLRAPLPAALDQLVRTLAMGGHTYLLVYHGDRAPFDRVEMGRDLTGWLARWPTDQVARLHVMVGPEVGVGEAEIWNRIRGTAAGRALLATGPAAFGLRGSAEALHWLAQYRTFLSAPDALPPGGATRVPTGGGLSLTVASSVLRPGGHARIAIARPGRAVVLLVPRGGTGRRIAAVIGPATRTVTLPTDVRPGNYVIRAVLLGDGLRDVAEVRVRIIRR